MTPGRHFSSQGQWRPDQGRLKTAVAGILVAVSFALVLLSASLDRVNAQTTAGPAASPPADELVLRFASPPGTSVREQYLGITVFWALLRRFADTAPAVRRCDLSMRSGDRFDAIRLIVKPPRADQRANCLRQIVHFALQGAIGEAEFVAARRQEVEGIVTWAYKGTYGGERLAYRVIYHDNSPLHQLNSISREDYANLRFADFIQWVNVSRRDGLMTFDGDPSMLEALDLKPAAQWDRISLSSAVVPPDVLFYDGERFGVPAMIMIRISAPGFAVGKSEIWKRFSCNRMNPAPPDLPAPDPISSVTCFSHTVFNGDHWLGLAIRKSADADDTAFCVAVKEFANRPDLASFTREASPDFLRPYVLLPENCRATTSSP